MMCSSERVNLGLNTPFKSVSHCDCGESCVWFSNHAFDQLEIIGDHVGECEATMCASAMRLYVRVDLLTMLPWILSRASITASSPKWQLMRSSTLNLV